MKKLKNIKLISFLFFLGIIVTSCVNDDDYNIPEMNIEEPNVNVNTDILSVKNLFTGTVPVLIEAGEGSEVKMYMSAYIVSSDETGNFYKSLVVQDRAENPTAGIAISTNATDMYTKFEPGRKIYFRVDGLYSGLYHGLPTLGIREGNEIGRMSAQEFEERIMRSTESVELVPQVLTISQATTFANPDQKYKHPYFNTLVKLEGVQFPNGLMGQSYGNLNDTFSVNKMVEDCDGNSIPLRTSGFADFKNELLPSGNGSLTSVLSYYNSDFQLFVRGTDDLEMNGERCSNGSGDTLPFAQNFDGQAAGTGVVVSIEGWTNVNVNGGQRVWEVREFDGNKYAQTSAFSSNENPYEVWMVTNGVNLPSGSAPTLTFGTKDGFYNGDALAVKISTNFTGNVNTATWTTLNATFSSGHANGYGDTFVSSGDIDLSAYAGQVVYIAFQYVGSTNGVTSTYQIDNISIME